MVQITSRDSVTVYKVTDDRGRTIGEVRQPDGKPVVGWGQETVLLRRPALCRRGGPETFGGRPR
jgi:hypothetical protein